MAGATQLTGGGYTQLDAGHYYVAAGNSVTYNGGLYINGNVTIELRAGAVLTAKGTNGSGTNGGRAGVYIPSGAKLNLRGSGTLNATGGNGGSAGNAGSGEDSKSNKDHGTNRIGAGGNGGSGAGGAAAGIGGNGGNGGGGGFGGAGSSYGGNLSINGNGGGNGGDGGSMGDLYVYDNVKVNATPGTANSNRGGGGSFGDATQNQPGSWYQGVTGGGGGGGGGAAGVTPPAIGGGGGGGGALGHHRDSGEGRWAGAGGGGGGASPSGYGGHAGAGSYKTYSGWGGGSSSGAGGTTGNTAPGGGGAGGSLDGTTGGRGGDGGTKGGVGGDGTTYRSAAASVTGNAGSVGLYMVTLNVPAGVVIDTGYYWYPTGVANQYYTTARQGENITFSATTIPAGYALSKWMCTTVGYTNVSGASRSAPVLIAMPANVDMTFNLVLEQSKPRFDGNNLIGACQPIIVDKPDANGKVKAYHDKNNNGIVDTGDVEVVPATGNTDHKLWNVYGGWGTVKMLQNEGSAVTVHADDVKLISAGSSPTGSDATPTAGVQRLVRIGADKFPLPTGQNLLQYKVTFDSKGGTVETSHVWQQKGLQMAEISKVAPVFPSNAKRFMGFYDKEVGGTQYYRENTTAAMLYSLDKPITLYAKWTGDIGIFLGRYSHFQVFDCKRTPALPKTGEPFRVFNFTPPYNDTSGSGRQMTEAQVKGKIFYFKPSGIASKPYVLWMADDVDGTNGKAISRNGRIFALGVEGLLFVSEGSDKGYFISLSQGFDYDDEVTYIPKNEGPVDLDDANNVVDASPSPWDPNKSFSVSFNSQGANTLATPSQISVRDYPQPALVGTLPLDPIKKNNSFMGWYTAPNGGGTQLTASTPVTKDIIVYAKWTSSTPPKYSVTLADSRSSLTPSKQFGTNTATKDEVWTGVILPKRGYKLPEGVEVSVGGNALGDGDYTYNNATGEIVIPAAKVDGAIEVTASGDPITYTIKYHANGAAGKPSAEEQTVTFGEPVNAATVGEMTTAPAHWSFKGWARSADAIVADYTAGQEIGTANPATFTDTATVTLYAVWDANDLKISIRNGSFEKPLMTSELGFSTNFLNGTPGIEWTTTASDKKMEFARPANNYNGSQNAYNTRAASEGEQFAELNANEVGALYQTVTTIPGTTLYWGADHRGRTGNDTMQVWIGKPADVQAALSSYVKNKNNVSKIPAATLNKVKQMECNTANNIWKSYESAYTVPAGQVETMFAFVAVATANNNTTCGNLLDNIYFSFVKPPKRKAITVRTTAGGEVTVFDGSLDENLVDKSNTPYNKSLEHGSVMQLGVQAKLGYTFNGGYIDGTFYQTKEAFLAASNNMKWTVGADTPTDISVLFSKNSTITFEMQGGTPHIDEVILTASGASQTYTLTKPSRQGFIFEGWSLAGSSTVFQPGDTISYKTNAKTGNTYLLAKGTEYSVEEGLILIAKWKFDDTFLTQSTVELFSNDDISKTPEKTQVISSSKPDYTLPAPNPQAGKKFTGWLWTLSGSTYQTGTKVTFSQNGSKPTVMIFSDLSNAIEKVQLTAQWSERQPAAITVKTKPKDEYLPKDKFDPTGLVITVEYDNGEKVDVPYAGNEGKFTFAPTPDTDLALTDSKVVISYTPDPASPDKKFSTDLPINVGRKKIAKPTITGTAFTYNGSQQGPTVTSGSDFTVTDGKKTDAGSYVVTIALKDRVNSEWRDGSTGDIIVVWTIAKKAVTVTANAKSITYGDVPQNAGVTYSGFVGGDTATGAVTYSYSYAQGGDVGSYTITPSVAGLIATNYSFTAATGVLTVVQRPVTLSWSSPASFIYDGTAKSVTATVANKVGSDDVTATYTSSNSATNVGSYAATVNGLTGAKAGNYSVTSTANKTLNWKIDKKTPTLKANQDALEMLDQATAGFTYTYDGDGAISVESSHPSIATASVSGNTVTVTSKGSGSVTVTIKAAASVNYSAAEDTVSVVIHDSKIAISAAGYNGIYDGQAHGITVRVSDALVGTTTMYGSAQDTYDQTVAPTYTNAGSYTVYYQVKNGDSSIDFKGSAVITITQAPLTITAANHSIVYGNAAANNGVTYSGFVGGESQSTSYVFGGSLAYTISYNQYGAVGSYDIVPGGLTSTNYSISYVVGKLAVTPAPLTLTWSTPTSFVYDSGAKSITATIGGVLNGDDVTIASYNDNEASLAGSYTASAVLGGAKLANYTLPPDATKAWSITQATNEWGDGAGGGETTLAMDGWMYGDSPKEPKTVPTSKYGTVVITYSNTQNGTYTATKPVNAGNWVVKAEVVGDANYAGLSKTAAFTITKAPLTVIAKDHKLTYGTAAANNGVEYKGLVNGDTAASLSLAPTFTYGVYNAAVPANRKVGSYDIVPGGLNPANYAPITYAKGKLTIEPLTVQLSWYPSPDFSYLYTGERVTGIGAQVANIISGDTCYVVVTYPEYMIPGSYTVTALSLMDRVPTGEPDDPAKVNPNYKLPNPPTEQFTMKPGKITGIIIDNKGKLFDNISSDAVNVHETRPNDKVYYTIDNGANWTTTIPQIHSAGNIKVKVKVVREHYEDWISDEITVVVTATAKLLINPPIFDATDIKKVTFAGSVTPKDYHVVDQKMELRKLSDNPPAWEELEAHSGDTNTVQNYSNFRDDLIPDTEYEIRLTATDTDGNTGAATLRFRTQPEKPPTGEITGSVGGGSSGTTYTVSIEAGNTVIASLLGLQEDDKFAFSKLPDGEYNLVAIDDTNQNRVTKMVTVKDGGTEAIGLVKVGMTQSVVKVEGDAPKIAANGLDDIFSTNDYLDDIEAYDNVDKNGGTVELRLTAAEVPDYGQGKTEKEAIRANIGSDKVGLDIDLKVDMHIIPTSGPTIVKPMTSLIQLLTVAVPLKGTDAAGKSGYKAYRYHADSVNTLTQLEAGDPPTEGSFRVEGEYLYIYSSNFSTYTLTYTVPPAGGGNGGGGSSYEYHYINLKAGKGGSLSTDRSRYRVRAGESVGFTITADEGYVIKDVMVDGVSVGAVDEYIFRNVRGDHSLTASFAKGQAVPPVPPAGNPTAPTAPVAPTTPTAPDSPGSIDSLDKIKKDMIDDLGKKRDEAIANLPADLTDEQRQAATDEIYRIYNEAVDAIMNAKSAGEISDIFNQAVRDLDAVLVTYGSMLPSIAPTGYKPFILLSALLALAAVAAAILSLLRRRRDAEQEEQQRTRSRRSSLLTSVAAVAAAVTFLLTTGWSGFAFVNSWTLLVAVFAAIALLSLLGSHRKQQAK